jgi:hypothetical protein
MLFAQLRLILEFELSDFSRLEQRYNDPNPSCLPRDNLRAEILATARACRECKPMRLYAEYPVQRRLKHDEGI